jgi:16S rRNA (uracil1498-N3)-methyltransferase
MRIYLPPELIAQRTGIILPSDKSRHVTTVMRLAKGSEFVVLDGMGKAHRAVITSMQKKDVIVDIIEETVLPAVFPYYLVLCPAVLKGEKMDFVVQKATELGVREIVPLIAERCQVRETRKVGRWQKIAEESIEQCGGLFLPVVHAPVAFSDFMKGFAESGNSGGLIFMEDWGLPADESLDRKMRSPGKIYLLIGPEGGFSSSELALAEQAGFVRSTLGSSVLRAETASVAALAVIRFILEREIKTG